MFIFIFFMNNKLEVQRFYDDENFRLTILDTDYQDDLIWNEPINELRKFSSLIESIIKEWKKNQLLIQSDKKNLINFIERISRNVMWIIKANDLELIDIEYLKHFKNYDEITDFFEIINYFKNIKNIDIKVDLKNKWLLIYNSRGELIWEITQSFYNDWYFTTRNHLYNVVEKKFRWQWWWYILYELYTKLHHYDDSFILPSIDYTNLLSMVELYKKFWFSIVSKMQYWFEENLTSIDFMEHEKIKQEYKSWLKERKLPYSIKIVKEL